MNEINYISDIKNHLPTHLHQFIQDYDYESYSSEDHSLWRYIVRQLKFQLSKVTHKDYLYGLEKAGIEIDFIPKIETIDKNLQSFGWRAVPVSGFIPPAAFMEFQANKALPIATAIRTIEHTHYTPAPDIVHEAAGHAPMLVNSEYSDYLQSYAQMASNAVYSKKDILVYTAIRNLSDIKEDSNATAEQITELEATLDKVKSEDSVESEAAKIAKMNWWTAEYGLLGDLENPQILGAGLLSSIGESRTCLGKNVKKIPLSIDCLSYDYDITKPQPQLFVAKSFKHLKNVLTEFESTMAFKVGGIESANKALESKTVNTFILDTGLQISGLLEDGLSAAGAPSYVRFSGPVQISYKNKELKGHGKEYHQQGYSSPLGYLNSGENLSKLSADELNQLGIKENSSVTLNFKSGLSVEGLVTKLFFLKERLALVSFKNCTVKNENNEVIFDPSWGDFDMATSCKISGVFGGLADPEAYHFNSEFDVITVPSHKKSKPEFEIYSEIRELRNNLNSDQFENAFESIFNKCNSTNSQNLWLACIELLELSYAQNNTTCVEKVNSLLSKMTKDHPELKILISDGILLAEKFNITHNFL